MTIKRQLYTNAWISCAAVVVVLLTLLLSARQVDLALQKSRFAGDINTTGISGLRTVTVDYLLSPQQRSLTQWQQRHAGLRKLLGTGLYQGSDEQAIMDRLIQRNDYLGEIFPKFINIYAGRMDKLEQDKLRREVEARLLTQMMVTTQDMVTDATELMHRSHAQLQAVQRRTHMIVALLVIALGLIVVANVFFSIRNILVPLRALRTGTQIVGAGNLAYRANMMQANEIGSLARSFDAMTENLARVQAEVQAKTTRLEDVVKELEAFSFSVSHDLRAPLRGIDGWSLALLEDYGAGLDETARSYLSIVRSEAQRMGTLIDDLLQLSRVTRAELRREPVDLTALAQSVASRLKAANPTRHIEFVIAPGLMAHADAHLIEVVLTNLLDNACKFTGTRAVATIEVGSTGQPNAPGKVFFVHDNGVGFDSANASKLFGPFQRLHTASEFPGTGIGLATVQRIMHRHGGNIWVSAQVGLGASFYFTLGEAS